MANEQNLRPCEYKFTQEEHKKGGRASGEARRRKRDIRLAFEALLEKNYKGKDGKMLSGAEAIALKQMEKALKGDAKAFELVRDSSGQKPVEKVMVAEVEQDLTGNTHLKTYVEEDGNDAQNEMSVTQGTLQSFHYVGLLRFGLFKFREVNDAERNSKNGQSN